jgi:electron transport complex protein RnfB
VREPQTAVDPAAELALRLDAALPQTQCTRCGYPDCRSYAQAMAHGLADINRCPPGGAEGVARLARISGRSERALDESCGVEAPRTLAVIDESWCIGCTLCIKACPVDCIVGAPKRMHTVIEKLCTGCELCIPVCPVDCIELLPAFGARSGWQGWSPEQADEARERFEFHRFRVDREREENDLRLAERAQLKLADLATHSLIENPEVLAAKRAVIEAALKRGRGAAQPTADIPDAD